MYARVATERAIYSKNSSLATAPRHGHMIFLMNAYDGNVLHVLRMRLDMGS